MRSARESKSAESQNSAWSWRKAVAQYQRPDEWRSWRQFIIAIVAFITIWVLAYFSLSVSYWLTLPLLVLGAGFMLRLFIIFHDCGHESFFKKRRLNHIVGIISGYFVFTPYFQWRHNHAIHHASSGDLDRRGVGDVWMMTVKEYQEAPWTTRLGYRLYRNPVVLFLIGPFYLFVIGQRFASKRSKRRERRSVYWLNLALLLTLLIAYFTIGLRAYVLIQLPMLWLAAASRSSSVPSATVTTPVLLSMVNLPPALSSSV